MPRVKKEIEKIENSEIKSLTEMVEYIARALVSSPDEVNINHEMLVEDDQEKHVIKLIVDENDKGKIIGKDGRVAQAIRLMEERLDKPVTIAAIAMIMKISVRRLEMLFSEHLGLSPAAYFTRLRLKMAQRLLKDTGSSIQEIALRTGFSSTTSFSRSFKRFSGVAPLKFRHSKKT